MNTTINKQTNTNNNLKGDNMNLNENMIEKIKNELKNDTYHIKSYNHYALCENIYKFDINIKRNSFLDFTDDNYNTVISIPIHSIRLTFLIFDNEIVIFNSKNKICSLRLEIIKDLNIRF